MNRTETPPVEFVRSDRSRAPVDRAEPPRAGAARPAPAPAPSVASAVAAVFALLGFVVSIVAGAAWGRDAESTLTHAITAMAILWPMGWIGARVVESQLRDAPSGSPSEADPRTSRGADDILGTIGPEENPTTRQELRTHARST